MTAKLEGQMLAIAMRFLVVPTFLAPSEHSDILDAFRSRKSQATCCWVSLSTPMNGTLQHSTT